MRNAILVAGAAAVLLAGGYWWTQSGGKPADAEGQAEPQALAEVTLPATLSDRARLGKQAFDGNCAACHGENASGLNGMGPPLVHRIYEPSHHGDGAFHVAVTNGVRSHHWKFGNMPPVEGLTRADVDMIVAYVRELQRTNGIN